VTLLMSAAGHRSGGAGDLIVLALIYAACYVVHNLIWPFRACHKCQGLGRFRSPSGRSWRYCGACGGRGTQVRGLRRFWTWWTRTKDRGSR
jgi:hypothetical protein